MARSRGIPAPGGPKPWALALAAAALLWFGGYLWFAAMIPVPSAAAAQWTDCIAVFTGRYERMSAGLSLLSGRQADRLFISGILEGTDRAELQRLRRQAPALYDCCTELGREAKDTAGNAAETANWARERGCGSVTLVTDDYHMPRSQLHLRRRLADRVIVPFPVPYYYDTSTLPAARQRAAVSEYSKYLVTLAFPRR